MTKKEVVDRSIGLTFDFIRGLVDNPEAVETIPNRSEIDFIEKDLPLKSSSSPIRRKVTR